MLDFDQQGAFLVF